MRKAATHRIRVFIKASLFALSVLVLFCGCTTLTTSTTPRTLTKSITSRPAPPDNSPDLPKPASQPAQAEIYSSRSQAPIWPEALAPLLDKVIEKHKTKVSLTLVFHPRPYTQPAVNRATWVCIADGKPLWMISAAGPVDAKNSSGITAAALARARKYLAQRGEARKKFRDQPRPLGWKPKKESFLPSYQAKEYKLQITELKLIDRKTQSWEITAKPIDRGTMGGQVWMWFSDKYEVSAEYGK